MGDELIDCCNWQPERVVQSWHGHKWRTGTVFGACLWAHLPVFDGSCIANEVARVEAFAVARLECALTKLAHEAHKHFLWSSCLRARLLVVSSWRVLAVKLCFA